MAAGILYNSYLGGDEGYTATLYDGKTLVQRVVLAGREPQAAGWHKWTFDFDPEAGLQVFHNGKELGAVDPAKVDLKGFTSDRHLGRPDAAAASRPSGSPTSA